MDEKIEKCFLDEYSDDFNEYIDNNRLSKWCKIPEYKELYDEISSIKLKYPKVIKFLEDGDFDTLSKENYIYLQNMDMLKI